MVIKFFIKLVAKIFAVPLILFLGLILLTYNTVEGIVSFLVGILNIVIVVGVFAAYFSTDSWDLAKQGLIFFAIESVLLGIPQLCAGAVTCLHDSLLEFMWA